MFQVHQLDIILCALDNFSTYSYDALLVFQVQQLDIILCALDDFSTLLREKLHTMLQVTNY